jgi:trans-aconitate 2-methyltransferase
MSDWNPDLYRQFEDERTRPASDLLAQVDLTQPVHAVDLGCGPGNSTQLLRDRFPSATILGTDTSEAMLVTARERLPACHFERSDIATWQPSSPPDLLFANASLQWVDDHATLIPRLFSTLAPGGTLAIQMPDNREEPTHRLMREVAALSPWSALIGNAASKRTKVLPIPDYYDLLSPLAAKTQVWRTVYHHPMGSAADIVEWLRATGLKPFVDPLPAALQTSFLDLYRERIAEAYPPRTDGRLLLAFPRMFIVAQRAA